MTRGVKRHLSHVSSPSLSQDRDLRYINLVKQLCDSLSNMFLGGERVGAIAAIILICLSSDSDTNVRDFQIGWKYFDVTF